MTRPAQFTCAAHMAGLPDAVDFVEAFCAGSGLAHRTRQRLALMGEELFTNVLEHGAKAGAGAQIRLVLDAAADAIELLFEDTAAPFDPLRHAREHPASVDAPTPDRPVGGLGIHLVLSLAADARYAREDGCNRLRLRLAYGDDDRRGAAPRESA